MVISTRIVLEEESLRRVRASTGRGGRATRSEARVWIDRVVQEALEALPAPKTRRVTAAGTARPDLPARIALAKAAPDDAVCGHCGRTKVDHGRSVFSCPAPYRTTFELPCTQCGPGHADARNRCVRHGKPINMKMGEELCRGAY